jgi:isocitrate/isopropylmalate dehydrogenase
MGVSGQKAQGWKYKITWLSGEGIGKEVMAASR